MPDTSLQPWWPCSWVGSEPSSHSSYCRHYEKLSVTPSTEALDERRYLAARLEALRHAFPKRAKIVTVGGHPVLSYILTLPGGVYQFNIRSLREGPEHRIVELHLSSVGIEAYQLEEAATHHIAHIAECFQVGP